MANDELDALDALEKEAREYDKVGRQTLLFLHQINPLLILLVQDAEIDRILKAFRLDA